MNPYDKYSALQLHHHTGGILEIVMGARPALSGTPSAFDHRLHRELAEIWRTLDEDDSVRVALIRGEGKGFSAGGELSLVEEMAHNFALRALQPDAAWAGPDAAPVFATRAPARLAAPAAAR